MASSVLRKVCAAGAVAAMAGGFLGEARAIVGGAPDPGFEASAVMILNEGGGFCTAIVLDARTLLTAGHCVAGGRQMRVYWRGDGGEPVMRAPASVAAHPGYARDAVRRRQRSIDLGLVRLAEALPSRFAPAELASRAGAAGREIAASGFGPTTRSDPKSAGVMRSARLGVVEPYGPSTILLWASAPAAGVCPGDSGGAMADGAGAVVAVIAWGGTAAPSGCGGTAQGVLVAPQRPWIDATLAGWGAAARWR